MKLTATLNALQAERPCQRGWDTLLRHVGYEADRCVPIDLRTVLESNGVADTIWCLRAVREEAAARHVAQRMAYAVAASTVEAYDRLDGRDRRPSDGLRQVGDGHCYGLRALAQCCTEALRSYHSTNPHEQMARSALYHTAASVAYAMRTLHPLPELRMQSVYAGMAVAEARSAMMYLGTTYKDFTDTLRELLS